MPHDPIKLGRNVTAQGWGDFEVMTADRQVHKWPPVALGLKKLPAECTQHTKPELKNIVDEFTMPLISWNCNPFL